ncbi:hypothetical protein RJ639_012635 [Escallonia herrerae]|uniref:Uncharacterized protein n=1 Tax=Escallonia herrerae TaxID=1293975 RepID=A0AA88VL07_9ASTE|nr:hypothetical protein RJ639_012635 [Escallonia herrerae]
MDGPLSPHASLKTKLGNKLGSDKCDLTYADLHSEIIRNTDNSQRTSVRLHQKQRAGNNSLQNEELVKYMSKLPDYLEKGGNLQDKALSVGVLNWRSLEKWLNNNKQLHSSSTRCSPSSSSNSFFSTDESSNLSSRGQSCSPARPKMQRHTLQFHFNASPQYTKSFDENVGKFPDMKAIPSNPLKGSQDIQRKYHAFSKYPSGMKLRECKRIDSDQHSTPEIKASPGFKNCGAPLSSKGKTKIRDGESAKEADKLEDPCNLIRQDRPVIHQPRQSIPELKASSLKIHGGPSSSTAKMKIQDGESAKAAEKSEDPYKFILHDCPGKHQKVVLLLPRDDHENRDSAISRLFPSVEMNCQNSRESSRRSFSEGSHSKDIRGKLPDILRHSCPLACEVDCIYHSQIEQPSSVDPKGVKLPSGSSPCSQISAKVSSSPSRSKMVEEKASSGSSQCSQISAKVSSSLSRSKVVEEKASTMPKNSAEGSDQKAYVAATKVRNRSPTRRFITGMGRIGRSLSSIDNAAVTQVSSKRVTAKSGEQRAEATGCSDSSTSNNPRAVSTDRSSPLRRLLDPLLKPKAVNSHQHEEPALKDSTSTERRSKTSDGPRERLRKAKLDLAHCRKIDFDDSPLSKTNGSSTVQALLQVAVKNGLPLFTFAVDNSSDVLAATVRKLNSSTKRDNSWIYTFFAIHEVKKKNGSWLSKGGKGKGHGFIPNVVAQMNVTDVPSPKLSTKHSTDQFSIRELVLFAVGLRQTDQQTSDLQPNDELAAIVVKFSKGIKQDAQQFEKFNDLSNVAGNSISENNDENGLPFGHQGCFTATVILPDGVHGLPSKGEPSPLIQRWESHGLCDCGGWDLGCKTRILASQTQSSMRSLSTKAELSTVRFELFSQGKVGDTRPVFSLSSFKRGIFSVEFSSSLSLLQAFSICIAVLDNRKPSELSQLGTLFEEKLFEETTSLGVEGTKVPNQVQVEQHAVTKSSSEFLPAGGLQVPFMRFGHGHHFLKRI